MVEQSGSPAARKRAAWRESGIRDARPTFVPGISEFRRNQFGGAIGAPIIKSKLFVFGDYQGFSQSTPVGVDFASVPTTLTRQGNFSELLNAAASGLSQPYVIRSVSTGAPFPGNIIPSNLQNPVGLNYFEGLSDAEHRLARCSKTTSSSGNRHRTSTTSTSGPIGTPRRATAYSHAPVTLTTRKTPRRDCPDCPPATAPPVPSSPMLTAAHWDIHTPSPPGAV